jgi:hypothetical protein
MQDLAQQVTQFNLRRRTGTPGIPPASLGAMSIAAPRMSELPGGSVLVVLAGHDGYVHVAAEQRLDVLVGHVRPQDIQQDRLIDILPAP